MRDALIAAMQATAAQTPVAVEVPKWGTVYVRAITVEEVEAQEADTEGKDKRRIARGAARVLCDAEGNRIFNPDSEADIDLIARQPWPLLRRVLAAAEQRDAPGN